MASTFRNSPVMDAPKSMSSSRRAKNKWKNVKFSLRAEGLDASCSDNSRKMRARGFDVVTKRGESMNPEQRLMKGNALKGNDVKSLSACRIGKSEWGKRFQHRFGNTSTSELCSSSEAHMISADSIIRVLGDGPTLLAPEKYC